MKIEYVTGDATEPQGEGPKIIAHICNDEGAWGAGFVMALSAKCGSPERVYRHMKEWKLGSVSVANFAPNVQVANMIAQEGFGSYIGGRWVAPIRYAHLATCLIKLRNLVAHNTSVHMPRIGCGLAGGEWDKIETLVRVILCEASNIPVTVYDL